MGRKVAHPHFPVEVLVSIHFPETPLSVALRHGTVGTKVCDALVLFLLVTTARRLLPELRGAESARPRLLARAVVWVSGAVSYRTGYEYPLFSLVTLESRFLPEGHAAACPKTSPRPTESGFR